MSKTVTASASGGSVRIYHKYSLHNIKKDFVKNWPLFVMVAPAIAILYYLLLHADGGLLMAFENYKPKLGLLGSEFVGLKNFADFLVQSTLGVSFATP